MSVRLTSFNLKTLAKKLFNKNAFKLTSQQIRCKISANSVSDLASFPGYKGEFSTNLDFLYPDDLNNIQCYRVMDRRGNIINEEQNPRLDKDTLLKMYKKMLLLTQLDKIMYEAQRQGRISFYLTNHGEIAAQIGSAVALDPHDLVYAQYRESGVLLWRGFSIQECCDQIFGNQNGSCKGKQMPIHYGSKEYHFMTISSPLATQMSQAVGSAFAYKRKQNGLISIVYFGDGAASEGDAHAAMNFANVYDVPMIFFCRNNGYAISTPVKEQYRGDGIASRGPGYGMVTIRVDGNDIFAVYNATKAAREIAIKESRPVLIEAMTYRLGHHSTSDDSTAYRSIDEMNSWEKEDNPILRFQGYLFKNKLLDTETDDEINKENRSLILQCVNKSENTLYSNPLEMFNEVYDKPSKLIQKQMEELREHLLEYKEKYPLKNYEKFE